MLVIDTSHTQAGLGMTTKGQFVGAHQKGAVDAHSSRSARCACSSDATLVSPRLGDPPRLTSYFVLMYSFGS